MATFFAKTRRSHVGREHGACMCFGVSLRIDLADRVKMRCALRFHSFGCLDCSHKRRFSPLTRQKTCKPRHFPLPCVARSTGAVANAIPAAAVAATFAAATATALIRGVRKSVQVQYDFAPRRYRVKLVTVQMDPVRVGVDHRNASLAKPTDCRSPRGSFHPDEQNVNVFFFFVSSLGVSEARCELCGESERNEVGVDADVPQRLDVSF